MFRNLFIFNILALLLSACGDRVDLLPPAETADFPGVVMLTGTGDGLCTGTFISRHAVLTAHHCVKNITQLNVHFEGQTLTATKVATEGAGDFNDQVDLALLTLDQPSPVSDAQVIPLATTSVSAGEVARLVGFGMFPGELFTKKRTGTNRIKTVGSYIETDTPNSSLTSAELVGVRGGRTQVAGSKGDSGGPLLKLAGNQWQIVGVVHAALEGGSITTLYTNLLSSQVQTFLRNSNQTHRLSIAAFDIP